MKTKRPQPQRRFAAILIVMLLPGCFAPARSQDKPNIVIILADDMGFSDIGCFGSEIRTPNLDRLAGSGLRMTQFYNAVRCCPTRASLMTGLYPHQTGVGEMTSDRGLPGYRGYLGRNAVTIAEALKASGYVTLMSGKWHLGSAKGQWPTDRGFDRSYALLGGASNYYNDRPYRSPGSSSVFVLDSTQVTLPKEYYITNAFTDHAIGFIDEQQHHTKPFFLYLAYTAPHWPLHALADDIGKYRSAYTAGYDSIRQNRYKKQLAEKILPASVGLSGRNETVEPWSSLSAAAKDSLALKMAIYAAQVASLDRDIGRLLQALKDAGRDRNTLVIFLSDNGGSDEELWLDRSIIKASGPPGEASSFTSYGRGWANVSNTPFRMFKKYTFEGGAATPFIAWYPGVIKPGISRTPAHVIDLMATCLDLAGGAYPERYAGNGITPLEGRSLVPLFANSAGDADRVIYWEHRGNKAVRKGDWKIVQTFREQKWSLYNMRADRSETNDVSAAHPEVVREMVALYQRWAARSNVRPWEQVDSVRPVSK